MVRIYSPCLNSGQLGGVGHRVEPQRWEQPLSPRDSRFVEPLGHAGDAAPKCTGKGWPQGSSTINGLRFALASYGPGLRGFSSLTMHHVRNN